MHFQSDKKEEKVQYFTATRMVCQSKSERVPSLGILERQGGFPINHLRTPSPKGDRMRSMSGQKRIEDIICDEVFLYAVRLMCDPFGDS